MVDAYYDSTINIGQSIQLYGIVSGSTGEEAFLWEPADYLDCTDCEDPLSTPLEDIVYYLTVVDENGCMGTDSIIIKVVQFFDLYIPTAFTPNGDGVNDRFSVLGDIDKVTDFKMWVFNRWNEVVYYSEDISTGWDGSYKGKDQAVDVFIYAIEATFRNGKSGEYKGYVVLLR